MTASFDEAASSGVGIRDGNDGDNIDIPAELSMIDRPESIDLRHLYSVSFPLSLEHESNFVDPYMP